jgi:MFS transporter, MFS domain-containing protein family, molybdate-anion transporter
MFYMLSFLMLAGGVGYAKYQEKLQQNNNANKGERSNVERPLEYIVFQRSYLTVYLLAMLADWLKGPYVYALYDSYGYNAADIATLFLSGFLASGITGPFIGSYADKYGRQKMCKAFFVIYILSAITKPINNYMILMIGRILSGFATSLLFSAFEAWMIQEHNRLGFSSQLLSETFTIASFGNGLVAILAGLVANVSVDYMGYTGPFMIAIAPLSVGLYIVHTQWKDDSTVEAPVIASNDGDNNNQSAGENIIYGLNVTQILEGAKKGVAVIQNDQRVLYLGLCQSLFEGAMYSFVFLWTPALTFGLSGKDKDLPFGLIFACFMTAVMGGSISFSHFLKQKTLEEIPVYIHGSATIASVCTAIFTGNQYLTFLTFVIFEGICGCFFPTFGTLRGMYIPEDTRTTVMNLFRIPLNLYVVILLQQMKTWNVSSAFICLGLTHLLCVGLYHVFLKTIGKDKAKYEAINRNDEEEDFGGLDEDDVEMGDGRL